jgi:predicted transcriptional regulator of viral defense system
MRGISRHKEVMHFIINFQAKHNRMPTRKEIVWYLEIGRGPLQRLLNSLEEKGCLKRLPKGILEFSITEKGLMK